MEPMHEPTPPTEAADAPPGELIVQNGRLAGTRRPLLAPLTFLGRDAGRDMRLNADGVAPLHCLLAHSPGGLLLRVLHGEGGTTVNGEPARTGTLHDGDLLGVGPFQFRLKLRPPAPPRAEDPADPHAPEKE